MHKRIIIIHMQSSPRKIGTWKIGSITFLSVNQRLIIFQSVNWRLIIFLSVCQRFIILPSVSQRAILFFFQNIIQLLLQFLEAHNFLIMFWLFLIFFHLFML